jgi:hypothetical protein
MPVNRELDLLSQAVRDLCERLELMPEDRESVVKDWYEISCAKYKHFPGLHDIFFTVKIATIAGSPPKPPSPEVSVRPATDYLLLWLMVGGASAIVCALPFLDVPPWAKAGLTGGVLIPGIVLLLSNWLSQWQMRLRLFAGSTMVLKSVFSFSVLVYSDLFGGQVFVNVGNSQNWFTDSLTLVIGYLLLKAAKSA